MGCVGAVGICVYVYASDTEYIQCKSNRRNCCPADYNHTQSIANANGHALSTPGMGTTHAEALSTKYERLANLLQADEQEIADVKASNGRRVGNALAKKVKAL